MKSLLIALLLTVILFTMESLDSLILPSWSTKFEIYDRSGTLLNQNIAISAVAKDLEVVLTKDYGYQSSKKIMILGGEPVVGDNDPKLVLDAVIKKNNLGITYDAPKFENNRQDLVFKAAYKAELEGYIDPGSLPVGDLKADYLADCIQKAFYHGKTIKGISKKFASSDFDSKYDYVFSLADMKLYSRETKATRTTANDVRQTLKQRLSGTGLSKDEVDGINIFLYHDQETVDNPVRQKEITDGIKDVLKKTSSAYDINKIRSIPYQRIAGSNRLFQKIMIPFDTIEATSTVYKHETIQVSPGSAWNKKKVTVDGKEKILEIKPGEISKASINPKLNYKIGIGK